MGGAEVSNIHAVANENNKSASRCKQNERISPVNDALELYLDEADRGAAEFDERHSEKEVFGRVKASIHGE